MKNLQFEKIPVPKAVAQMVIPRNTQKVEDNNLKYGSIPIPLCKECCVTRIKQKTF